MEREKTLQRSHDFTKISYRYPQKLRTCVYQLDIGCVDVATLGHEIRESSREVGWREVNLPTISAQIQTNFVRFLSIRILFH